MNSYLRRPLSSSSRSMLIAIPMIFQRTKYKREVRTLDRERLGPKPVNVISASFPGYSSGFSSSITQELLD